MKKIAIFGLICIVIDQMIKILINQNMILNSSINVISGFFSITYVRNLGAAFSMFYGNRFFLIAITVFALIFIYFVFLKNKKINNVEAVMYGILLGGILGNLIDRFVYGYVIDYLDFNIFGYDFPIFNFADICIVVSIILILIMTLRRNNNG